MKPRSLSTLTNSLIPTALAVLFLVLLTQPADAQSCIFPVGAIPNDGLDDREALQDAIDSAIASSQDLCLPPGQFDVTVHPTQIASLEVDGPLRIVGAGRDSTTLAMLGSGIRVGDSQPANWRMLQVTGGATDVVVEHLALDGSARVETGEQTHLLNLTGPITNFRGEHLKLTLPKLEPPPLSEGCGATFGNSAYCDSSGVLLGYFGGGDCVRLLGEVATPVDGVELRHVWGTDCDRAAFSFQRGVNNVLIEDSRGRTFSDQALDMEPSGVGTIENVTIRRVLLDRGEDSSGYTAAIGGQSDYPARNLVLEDVVIVEGALHVINAIDVTLRRVFVNSGTVTNKPTLHVRKEAENLRVIDSHFVRPQTAIAKPVVAVSHQSGRVPDSLSFWGGSITQGTVERIINADSLRVLDLADVQLRYSNVTPYPNSALRVSSVIADSDEVNLAGVSLVAPPGSFTGLLRATAYVGYLPPAVRIINSNAVGLIDYGLFLAVAGTPAPPVLVGNIWDAANDCIGLGC